MLPSEPLSTREARAALAAILGDALPPLRRLRLGRRLEDLAVFGGLWAVGLALAALSGTAEGAATWALRAGAVAASGLALNAFVLLLHEGMHGVLFHSPALNRWASVLLGGTVGMSFSAYRVLHTLHHDHLGTDDDPDDYAAYTRNPVLFWLLQGVRLTVGAAIYLVAIPVLALMRGQPADRVRIAQEYAVLAVLWAAAFALVPTDLLVWGWLAPLPVVALLTQVRGLTQHGLTDRHDALLSSRTVRPHPVVAFLLLNENYHLEHHLFPEVPSYHLPALHRAAWAHLPRACEDTSYLGFLGRFLRQSLALDETPVGVVRPRVGAGREERATDRPARICEGGTAERLRAAPESLRGAPETDRGTRETACGALENESGAPENDGGVLENKSGTRENERGAPENDCGARESDCGALENDFGAPETARGTRDGLPRPGVHAPTAGMRARLANAAWAWAARPAAAAFHRALAEPERAQERLLCSILHANRDAAYGRIHGFDRVRSLRQFQDAVPLASWDDVAPYVDRIAAGEAGVLTAEPVRLLEPTGGSSGGTKLIPYTRTLQAQVRAAVAPWIADLFRHVPSAARGPAFWSVSPAVPHRRTPGGVPVGFEDDGAYLSPLHRTLARATLAAPGALRHVADAEAFRYATLRHLVARRDLALISVWNPTFFALLLRPLRIWADRLADDLERGTLSVPAPTAVAARLGKDARRAAELRRLAAEASDTAALAATLWPRLALVSAWADAHAAGPARDLQELLPHAAFQAKGLLATEGVVTIPLWGHPGAAPALTSHVLEFEPEGGGRPLFAHEVEMGGRYGVVLTTGGGLYRYRLGDRVEAVGRVRKAPLLRFLGREGPISDRVGEKLHEGHVARALAALDLGGFTLVAPDGGARPCRYVLFAESAAPGGALAEAARQLDAALGENVHYEHARRIGQLGPVAAFRVRGDGARAYLDGCRALGQRLGDVKPAALHRDGGWAGRFEGAFVDAPPDAV